MWQDIYNTSVTSHQLKSDKCLGESHYIRRRLAHAGTSREHHWTFGDNSNPTSTPSLRRPPSTTRFTTGSRQRHLDITSTAKLLECSSGHHRYVQTSSLQQRITLDIFQLQQSGSGHTSNIHSGTSRELWQLHYKFLISPRLPQRHSLPLRQLIPLNINSYCDSDWATDIDSRKSTSGTVTSVLQVPLAFNSRTQSTVATSSAEAELYAIGLGISDSLHIYQLLQELQHHLQ